MLIEAVEKRFATVEAVPPGHTLEFSRTAALHRAPHSAHCQVARADSDQHSRLQPAGNGIVDKVFNTFGRDYERSHGPG